jgi:LPPG:FO 2-phospho-L-lactate transferase
MTKIVAFAGGVGGAKLAWGLAKVCSFDELTIIVNTGDDFEHFGLKISPDLDTVCYTLADLANPQTGWGRKEETWNVLDELKRFGAPGWFNIGDKDLALHLERARLLQEGLSLSRATISLCKSLGIKHAVLPMSDQPVRTRIDTKEYGVLPFQEYFVKYQCQPTMITRSFDGVESAKMTAPGRKALEECDLVIFCPSNPWVSIDPILEVEDTRQLVSQKTCVAVSPIIGGQTVKGPAAKMYREMGIEPSALAIAEHYRGVINGLVIDKVDENQVNLIAQCGIMCIATKTLMSDNVDREKLARETIFFAKRLKKV